MNGKSVIKHVTDSVVKSAGDIFGNRLVSVILYGSYARGDYDDESDIDIMLLVDMSQDDCQNYRDKITKLSSTLSLENDITVSIKVKDYNHFLQYKNLLPFYKNILDNGVTINAAT